MIAKAAVVAWWLLAISFPGSVAFGILTWLDGPHIGVDAAPASDGGITVTAVHLGGEAWLSGAKVGDILLEIDGATVSEQRWKLKGDRGTQFRILRTSDGKSISGAVTTSSAPAVIGLFSFLTISFAFASTSLFVFARSRHSAETLTLSVLFLTGATAFALGSSATDLRDLSLYVQRSSLLWSAALFFTFFSLVRHGPGDRWSIPQLSRWVMLVSALTLSILFWLSVAHVPEIYDWVRRLLFAHIGIGLLGGLSYHLVGSYLLGRSPVATERLRITVFGIAAAVLPFAILSVTPGAFGQDLVAPPDVTILGVILVPLSFGYAIMRHQFMGIRRLVHRGVAYAMITLAVFAIYGALIAALRAAGGSDVSSNVTIQILLLVVLFVAIPSISGTRRLAFAAVDRLLYKEYTDHPELARRVSIDAAHARHVDDLKTLVLGTLVEELRLSFAAFAGLSDGRVEVKASAGSIPYGLADTLRSDAAQSGGQTPHVSKLDVSGNGGPAIIVKLMKEEQGAWILCLGPKLTEEPFQRADLGLAESVVGHVATIVEKLDLLEELRTKAVERRELNRRLVESQEAERARVAGYLHDEPLQEITNLIWRYSDKRLPRGVQADLQRIADSLRNFAVRLHPAMLEDLGLVRALEWLGLEASAASGFEFVFEPENLSRNDRLDPEVELALYRIAQEALTNCQKHAEAARVWLRLSRNNGLMTLMIEDDGVGFQSGKVSGAGATLGLVGMRERVEQVGGDLRVSHRHPRGTKVEASLPIARAAVTSQQVTGFSK